MVSLRPSRWPLSIKVPLLLAVMMVVVAAGISKAVLDRLEQSQQSHLQELKSVFLQGLSTALQPYVIRRDPWEIFDVLDRARERYSAVKASVTVVVGADGKVLASANPAQFPIGSTPPEELTTLNSALDLDDPRGAIWIKRDMKEAGVYLGFVAALVDVTHIQKARLETLWALIGFNALLTLLVSLVGWVLVRRTMQPLTRLSELLAESADGRLQIVQQNELPPPDSEAGKAYRRYNTAAAAVMERELLLQRLASEERAALIGKYASAVAHEVNNPLGGMLNAVRMIQRHGDDPMQREKAASLLERGLNGIRNVVKASLDVWRGRADLSDISGSDVEDLRFLVESEAERRKLRLRWENDVKASVPVRAQSIRQIALNLLLNACQASPIGGTVRFRCSASNGALKVEIQDEGSGLPEDQLKVLSGEAQLSIPTSGGLGIWTVTRLVSELGGKISVDAREGTRIEVKVPYHANISAIPTAA